MNKILKTPFIKNILTKIKITSFTVISCHVIPHVSATVYVNFIDEDANVYPRHFILKDEEYDNWEDDTYLYSYINESIHIIF